MRIASLVCISPRGSAASIGDQLLAPPIATRLDEHGDSSREDTKSAGCEADRGTALRSTMAENMTAEKYGGREGPLVGYTRPNAARMRRTKLGRKGGGGGGGGGRAGGGGGGRRGGGGGGGGGGEGTVVTWHRT